MNNTFEEMDVRLSNIETLLLDLKHQSKQLLTIQQACDTLLKVSQLVKTAFPNQSDLIVPAEVVRDEKGSI